MAEGSLQVDVVSAERMVWEGEAVSVVARTTEGDIGILRNHEPLLAALVPCAAEVLGADGVRYVIAVDGGFISVDNNRVALLAQYARLAEEIDGAEAEREFARASKELEAGNTDTDNMHHYNRAMAQLRAIEKRGGR